MGEKIIFRREDCAFDTGPGALIAGLDRGIVFSAAGYFGADWVADHIDKN